MNLLLTYVYFIFSVSFSFSAFTNNLFILEDKKMSKTDSLAKRMEEFFKKDSVTILITDSGLGGMSVCADIENKMQKYKIFRKVKLVFFNAQPKSDTGYNRMKSRDRKIHVFDNVLDGMVKWYNPDIILVACNTLSVLYAETNFSKKTNIPVVSIVNFGVDMIFDKLKNDPESRAIIFGTETTIAANSHKKLLISMGIDSERIVTQPCKDLAGEIESDSRSEAVKNLVGEYSKQAVSNLIDKDKKLYAGLCCTHYGYCSDIFTGKIKEQGIKEVQILDPNYMMSDFVFPGELKNRNSEVKIDIEIVSRIKISPDEIKSIGSLIKKVSENTYKVFEKYNLNEDLFIVE
jgi:glutamate racemase